MLSPSEHYEAADRLLGEVAAEDSTLPYVRGKLWRAQVHAQLAQCAGLFYGDGSYVPYPVTGLVTPEMKGEML